MERRWAAGGWLHLVLFIVAASQLVHSNGEYGSLRISSDEVVRVRNVHARRTVTEYCTKRTPGFSPTTLLFVKPGVHTNDFATIHGRPVRIHTALAEDNTSNQQSTPQALCEYGRGDRESWRNR